MDNPLGSDTGKQKMDDPPENDTGEQMGDPPENDTGEQMGNPPGIDEGKQMDDRPGSDAGKLQFYPPETWGLDMHFHIANKMYIIDVLQMPEHPLGPGAFIYKNHPIIKVDVMGTVVKKSQNSKCHTYGVDDGTGVILCCCWKVNSYEKPMDFSSLPACLQAKGRELQLSQQEDTEGYSLGDYIHIKGKVKIFRGQKEIVAYYHVRVEDPMMQVVRLMELPLLYTKHHDVPYCPPRQVAEALNLTGDNSTSKTEASIVKELKNAVDNHITTDTSIGHLLIDDLVHLPEVKAILSQLDHTQTDEEKQRSLLVQALTVLAELGHVVRRNDNKQMYEVLLHNSMIEEMIMKILKSDIRKPKCQEKGCHYLHVRDELRKTYQYAGVETGPVQYCLSKLEHQSDVIRSTHTHYIAI